MTKYCTEGGGKTDSEREIISFENVVRNAKENKTSGCYKKARKYTTKIIAKKVLPRA